MPLQALSNLPPTDHIPIISISHPSKTKELE